MGEGGRGEGRVDRWKVEEKLRGGRGSTMRCVGRVTYRVDEEERREKEKEI